MYFVEVAKEKSFTRAAANCYISQPALSKSVRQLEEELNSKLFIRDYANFELTEEGEILFADAIDIIDSFDSIKTRIEMAQGKVGHPIKIALSPLLGNACFGDIIASFCEQNPGMSIDYYETDKLSLAYPNYIKEIDLSILLLPQNEVASLSDFMIKDLASCHLMSVVSKHHELAKAQTLSLKSFLNETIITAGDVLQIIIENGLNQVGKKHIFSSSTADYVQKMILQKGGVLILPDFIALSMAENALYQLIPLEYDITCRLVMIIKKHARDKETLKAVEKHILNVFNLMYGAL